VKQEKPEILLSTQEFFLDTVEEAFERLNFQTIPHASSYLVSLLDHFCFTDNLFDLDEVTGKRKLETLAEMYLQANQKDNPNKQKSLRKLGDTSLYISGFFSDSLKKKIIDLDYYIEMGERAYGTLAHISTDDISVRVYTEFSQKFINFVDVLTYISQKSMANSNEDLLRLYDRYITTGSSLAREQLLERGLLNAEVEKKMKNKKSS
jgi:hypothetical protein